MGLRPLDPRQGPGAPGPHTPPRARTAKRRAGPGRGQRRGQELWGAVRLFAAAAAGPSVCFLRDSSLGAFWSRERARAGRGVEGRRQAGHSGAGSARMPWSPCRSRQSSATGFRFSWALAPRSDLFPPHGLPALPSVVPPPSCRVLSLARAFPWQDFRLLAARLLSLRPTPLSGHLRTPRSTPALVAARAGVRHTPGGRPGWPGCLQMCPKEICGLRN